MNRDMDGGSPSSQHVLGLDLSNVSGPYRDQYSAEVSLPYGEEGAANNLTASVTIPISRLNASISGRLSDTDGDALASTQVMLVQRLPLAFDASGQPTNFVDVQVDSARTNGEGRYAFSGAEASSEAFLRYRMNGQSLGRDPANGYFQVPAGQGGSVSVDRGEKSVTPPPFEARLVAPERGADVEEDSVSFVFRFSAPVADNPFTATDAPFGDESMRDFFELQRLGPKTRSTGDLELDLSFNSDRTQLTVSTAEPLQDGSRYEMDVAAFSESGFESLYGQPVSNGGDFTGPDAIAFSVGINESAPATPTLQFLTDDGTQPEDNGTPLDYGDDFSVRFRVPATDPNVELKEYEVFVKSGDGDFEAIDTAPLDDFTPDGSNQVDFRVTFQGDGDDPLDNFVGSQGDYNEKQIRVRAVSINNVRSDFSNTLTIADQNRLNIASANIQDTDDDGEDELVAEFNEPVESTTIAVGAFTVLRDGSELSGVLEDAESQFFNGTEVVLEISDSYTPNDGFSNDELRADVGGVTDLANNGIDDDSNANVVNIP